MSQECKGEEGGGTGGTGGHVTLRLSSLVTAQAAHAQLRPALQLAVAAVANSPNSRGVVCIKCFPAAARDQVGRELPQLLKAKVRLGGGVAQQLSAVRVVDALALGVVKTPPEGTTVVAFVLENQREVHGRPL